MAFVIGFPSSAHFFDTPHTLCPTVFWKRWSCCHRVFSLLSFVAPIGSMHHRFHCCQLNFFLPSFSLNLIVVFFLSVFWVCSDRDSLGCRLCVCVWHSIFFKQLHQQSIHPSNPVAIDYMNPSSQREKDVKGNIFTIERALCLIEK